MALMVVMHPFLNGSEVSLADGHGCGSSLLVLVLALILDDCLIVDGEDDTDDDDCLTLFSCALEC